MGSGGPEEKLASAVIRVALGVEVEDFDTDGRQGVVDALIHYPDGRKAALEVSSLGPADEARLAAALRTRENRRRQVEGLRNLWFATVPHDYPPRKLGEIDKAILRCEALGYDDLVNAYYGQDDENAEPELGALVDMYVSASTARQAGASPELRVSVAPVTGFLNGDPDLLAELLAEELGTSGMVKHLEKLRRAEQSERHLFLVVRSLAFPLAVYDRLVFGSPDLPTRTDILPDGITAIWLTAGPYVDGGALALTADTWTKYCPYSHRLS